jgi:hypothetical protein
MRPPTPQPRQEPGQRRRLSLEQLQPQTRPLRSTVLLASVLLPSAICLLPSHRLPPCGSETAPPGCNRNVPANLAAMRPLPAQTLFRSSLSPSDCSGRSPSGNPTADAGRWLPALHSASRLAAVSAPGRRSPARNAMASCCARRLAHRHFTRLSLSPSSFHLQPSALLPPTGSADRCPSRYASLRATGPLRPCAPPSATPDAPLRSGHHPPATAPRGCNPTSPSAPGRGLEAPKTPPPDRSLRRERDRLRPALDPQSPEGCTLALLESRQSSLAPSLKPKRDTPLRSAGTAALQGIRASPPGRPVTAPASLQFVPKCGTAHGAHMSNMLPLRFPSVSPGIPSSGAYWHICYPCALAGPGGCSSSAPGASTHRRPSEPRRSLGRPGAGREGSPHPPGTRLCRALTSRYPDRPPVSPA